MNRWQQFRDVSLLPLAFCSLVAPTMGVMLAFENWEDYPPRAMVAAVSAGVGAVVLLILAIVFRNEVMPPAMPAHYHM